MKPYAATGILATALLLTSCGITDTGPHRAGPAATGLRPTAVGPTNVLHLYFYSPQGLQRVSRPSPVPGSPQAAVDLLIQGPTPAERARGLVTFLPAKPPPRILAVDTQTKTVDVRLPTTWSANPTPQRQLVCSVADAASTSSNPPRTINVRLHYTDTDAGTEAACPL